MYIDLYENYFFQSSVKAGYPIVGVDTGPGKGKDASNSFNFGSKIDLNYSKCVNLLC